MKTRSSYLLLFLGVSSLIAQFIFLNQRENRQLTAIIQQQEQSTKVGIDERWRNYLLTNIEDGKITQGYKLLFDRMGSSPRKIFFPFLPVQLSWLEYRQSVTKKDANGIRTFLNRALAKPNSWDRILALSEWHRAFKEKLPTQTAYEETLFSEEAKYAYTQIFGQFDNTKDYSAVSKKWTFDKVFYHLTDDGSIEAFVPSINELNSKLLKDFLTLNNLTKASLNINPFALKDITLLSKSSIWRHYEWAWIILSFCLIVSGLLIYLSTLKSARLGLLRKLSFLNQIVHEIKTPLTGLKLHLQLIQKGQTTPENVSALGTSVDRINQLFDDIVAINRPQVLQKLERIPALDLNALFEKLAQEFQQLTIIGNVQNATMTQINSLELILRNLIKNGIRYGDSVEIKLNEQTEYLMILVSDRGPGVATTESKKIFDEFYRSESAKLKNPDGLGIGLSIVKKIASELEIVVKLENPGEKGAIFSLRIPRGRNV